MWRAKKGLHCSKGGKKFHSPHGGTSEWDTQSAGARNLIGVNRIVKVFPLDQIWQYIHLSQTESTPTISLLYYAAHSLMYVM